MKSIAAKILLFVCVICIVLGGGVAIYAADTTPKISITLDNTKKECKHKTGKCRNHDLFGTDYVESQ